MSKLLLFTIVSCILFAKSTLALERGFYQEKCKKISATKSTQEESDFDEKNMFFSIKHFSDDNCKELSYTFSWKERYGLWDKPINGLTPIDFMLSYIKVTPHTQEMVDIFNSKSFCERSHWKLGKRMIVTGRVCDGKKLDHSGLRTYNTFLFKDGQLFIDFKNSNSDIKKRPIKLSHKNHDRILYYICQADLREQNSDKIISTEITKTMLYGYTITYRFATFLIETPGQTLGYYPHSGASIHGQPFHAVRMYRLYGDRTRRHYDNPQGHSDLLFESQSLFGEGSMNFKFDNYHMDIQCRYKRN